MIAGIAYKEFGGDPPIFDSLGYIARNLLNKVDITGLGIDSYTSFGNISMQLRRAAETLHYYKAIDDEVKKEMIKLLVNDRTALILVARHLVDLKNIDFPDKEGLELTDEEMAVVVDRYNVGPDVSMDTAKNVGYAQDFLRIKSKLESWLQ